VTCSTSRPRRTPCGRCFAAPCALRWCRSTMGLPQHSRRLCSPQHAPSMCVASCGLIQCR
jgi:hypothetical protein